MFYQLHKPQPSEAGRLFGMVIQRPYELNEDMWTELFLMNRGPLVDEIEHIIARLTEYRDAIANNDAQRLHDLLKEGRELKELSNNS